MKNKLLMLIGDYPAFYGGICAFFGFLVGLWI